MRERPYWRQRIELAWKKAPIVWLSGVRRSGKTTLAKLFPDATFLNCDSHATTERVIQSDLFFRGITTPYLILDEIHQLPDPSRILKIGADDFPQIKILATGSSKLQAAKKFQDSLTGRKRNVHLTPVLLEELGTFQVSLEKRLLHGGLPPALLSPTLDRELYSEWMDSYFARDIQELFAVEKRHAFLTLLELLLRQSGGLVEYTNLAKHAGISKPTVMNYLQIFETTHVATLLRPFSHGNKRELLAQPKVYGFDTGFICFSRGWKAVTDDNKGILWEHIVLETLQSLPQGLQLHFWRDKSQREIDFVISDGGEEVHAIECKWNPTSVESKNFAAFRSLYPKGRNFVIHPGATSPYEKKSGDMILEFQLLASVKAFLAGL